MPNYSDYYGGQPAQQPPLFHGQYGNLPTLAQAQRTGRQFTQEQQQQLQMFGGRRQPGMASGGGGGMGQPMYQPPYGGGMGYGTSLTMQRAGMMRPRMGTQSGYRYQQKGVDQGYQTGGQNFQQQPWMQYLQQQPWAPRGLDSAMNYLPRY
jgi:hypothetical protein